MTRREEINQQASLTVFPWDDVREQSKFEDGFIQGAEWADKTMIDKAYEYAQSKYDLEYCGNVRDVLNYLKSLVEE